VRIRRDLGAMYGVNFLLVSRLRANCQLSHDGKIDFRQPLMATRVRHKAKYVRHKAKYGEQLLYAGLGLVVMRRNSLAITSDAYGEYSRNYALALKSR
jgi:hypothetical protein